MTYDPRREDLLHQSAASDGNGGFVPVVARDMSPGARTVVSSLEPCPHCGGLACCYRDEHEVSVQCEECNARSPNFLPTDEGERLARAAWNRRPAASTDPRDALIAELCEALEPFETAITTIDTLPDVIRPTESHDAPTYLRLLAKQVTIADLRKAATAIRRARGQG